MKPFTQPEWEATPNPLFYLFRILTFAVLVFPLSFYGIVCASMLFEFRDLEIS